MKSTVLLIGTAALVLVGCASSDSHRYSRHRGDRIYVTDEPRREVIIDRDGNRTYVRDHDYRHDEYRGSAYYQNNMEPRVRGKHAEALGWNTENYYLQRGY